MVLRTLDMCNGQGDREMMQIVKRHRNSPVIGAAIAGVVYRIFEKDT